MKKIININLSGRVIPIEDSAYESLQRYIESLRRYFAHEEGRDEIINDIESRIAELMNDKIRKGASAVTDQDVEEIIQGMGRVEDFERTEQEDRTEESSTAQNFSFSGGSSRKGRLYRDASDKFLGGVCAGIANYMNVDPAIVRLIFAIFTLGSFGSGVLIYLALWILLPVRDLDGYVGKRFFRNPDDRIIAGVAGGLGAYFNKPSYIFRLLFAAPLLLNIFYGIINGIFFMWGGDMFPNFFIGSFTGTFFLAYIILWIVLPEARSPFEKMEMRGEKVDVNRIRQNVQEGMGDFRTRMESWSEEVKASADRMSQKAKEFGNKKGKNFGAEMSAASRPAARGCAHFIAVIFKAFLLFIVGSVLLAIMASLMTLLFSGVAWWPINNFFWTSSYQKVLAWGSLLLFLVVPVVALLTWLIRRLARVKSRNSYLGWTFGGLWTAGWIFMILFVVSMVKDFRSFERVREEVRLTNPGMEKMLIHVQEPPIRYSAGTWWFDDDARGWDITEDSLRYNNVKLRITTSTDSSFHVAVFKYSAGNSAADARTRAEQLIFRSAAIDSVIHIGSGLVIDKKSKFRMQGVIVEIQVPVGKQIRFDESVRDAYNYSAIRISDRSRRYNWDRNRFGFDWDHDEYFRWRPNVDYIMTTEGDLIDVKDAVITETGVHESKSNEDRLKEIERKQRELEREQEEIRREKERLERQNRTDSVPQRTGFLKIRKTPSTMVSFIPMII